MPHDPSKDVESLLRLMPGADVPEMPNRPVVPEEELPGIGHPLLILDDTMYFKTMAGIMEAGDPPVQAQCSWCHSMFYVPASYDPDDPESELRCRFCGARQGPEGREGPEGNEGRIFSNDTDRL